MIPLGIRNNNPGNLRPLDKGVWKGQFSVDSNNFCIFDTPENGIRALARDLLAYEDKDNLISLRQFIWRWAPPDENDSGAYLAAVSKFTGVMEDATYELHDRANLVKITKAIVLHENGQQPYSDAQIEGGVDAALGV